MSRLGSPDDLPSIPFEIAELYAHPNAAVDVVFVRTVWAGKKERACPNNISGALWSVGARVLTFGFDADEYAFGDKRASSDPTHRHAQTLLSNLISKRKNPVENDKPIIFVAHSLGAIVLRSALGLALNDSNDSRSILDSTFGVIFLDTCHSAAYPTLWDQILQPLGLSHNAANDPYLDELKAYKPDLMISFFPCCLQREQQERFQLRRWTRILGNICLGVGQLACIIVMGDYKPSVGREGYQTEDPGSSPAKLLESNLQGSLRERLKLDTAPTKMLWPCAQIQKHSQSWCGHLDLSSYCDSNVPDIILQPTPTFFVYMCMTYGILAMVHYRLNKTDWGQQPIFIFGLACGIGASIFAWILHWDLNILTTIMPLSMSFSLIFSAILHWLWRILLPSRESNVESRESNVESRESHLESTIRAWVENAAVAAGTGDGKKEQDLV